MPLLLPKPRQKRGYQESDDRDYEHGNLHGHSIRKPPVSSRTDPIVVDQSGGYGRLPGGSGAERYSGSLTRGLPRPHVALLLPENLQAFLQGGTCPPRDGSDLLVSETGPVLISLHLSRIAYTQADVRLATCNGPQPKVAEAPEAINKVASEMAIVRRRMTRCMA